MQMPEKASSPRGRFGVVIPVIQFCRGQMWPWVDHSRMRRMQCLAIEVDLGQN